MAANKGIEVGINKPRTVEDMMLLTLVYDNMASLANDATDIWLNRDEEHNNILEGANSNLEVAGRMLHLTLMAITEMLKEDDMKPLLDAARARIENAPSLRDIFSGTPDSNEEQTYVPNRQYNDHMFG